MKAPPRPARRSISAADLPQARQDYAEELLKLKEEFMQFRIPDQELAGKTLRCIEGTLGDIAALG